MNNPWRQQVNASLRKASLLCDLAERDGAELSRLGSEALLEASLLQLGFTLRAYFNELAENYQCAAAGNIGNLDQLQQALLDVDKQPAELNELLVARRESWLGQLLAAHDRIGQLKAASGGSVQQVRPGLIETRQVQAGELDFDSLQAWLQRFRELLDRHREMMVEC